MHNRLQRRLLCLQMAKASRRSWRIRRPLGVSLAPGLRCARNQTETMAASGAYLNASDDKAFDLHQPTIVRGWMTSLEATRR